MVVACLALAISLSGVTYAVSTALPRNSVGTLQLKNNAGGEGEERLAPVPLTSRPARSPFDRRATASSR
jgi:hypothetical protein